MKPQWTKTNDYYNREVVTQDVWSRKCRRGKIFVIDRPGFTYTFSCGPNSDYSFTGCFFGCSKITTVQQAMDVIDSIADIHFRGESFTNFLENFK